MNYAELNITVSDDLQAEILTALLADYPFESFQTEDGVLKAYIPEDALSGCRTEVNAQLRASNAGEWHYAVVGEENWNAEWERSFDPVDVDGRLLIRAPFHAEAPAGVEQVVIMPHMSFGTGHHATTHLMTAALLDLNVEGRQGLDMGSGTGVLAIVAARRGARHVDAVDIDAWADENCRSNVAENGVSDRVHPLLGDLACVMDNRYDFILANINRNILTAHMPTYASMLTAGGDLLLSGFLECDAPQVAASAEAEGLKAAGTRLRDGWAMILCTKR